MFSVRYTLTKILKRLKLNKIAHKLYYNCLHGFQPANRVILPALDRCIDKACESGTLAHGDYYEFGIFKGYALYHAQTKANDKNMYNLRFFGFDSFSGLPPIQTRDETHDNTFYQGQYCRTRERVTQDLTRAGIDWERTFLIEGYFSESLNDATKRRYAMGKIAIALIDCDLYASTCDVLNFIQDMIVDKTILIFDDWNCFDKDDEKGQRKAFSEFLTRNPGLEVEDYFDYGLYGKVFIIHL